MRGEVEAGRSELGGLRVDVRLRAAVVPSDVAGAPAESAEAATSGTPRAVAG
jgi:hypothetical protein